MGRLACFLRGACRVASAWGHGWSAAPPVDSHLYDAGLPPSDYVRQPPPQHYGCPGRLHQTANDAVNGLLPDLLADLPATWQRLTLRPAVRPRRCPSPACWRSSPHRDGDQALTVMMSSTRHQPRHRRAEVLCTGGAWRRVEIVAWARCQAGWAALIRWPDGHQDWQPYQPTLIRPAQVPD